MRLAFAIGILLAIPALAGNSSHEAAENMIRAMRADELAAQLVERSVRWDCEYRKCKNDLKVCLTTLDRDDLMLDLVYLAKKELTPAEMEAATAYFRSDVGMRHREIIQATRKGDKASMNDQKPEVRAAMLAFLDTPAGYRLITRSLLTDSIEFNRVIRRYASSVREECRPTE